MDLILSSLDPQLVGVVKQKPKQILPYQSTALHVFTSEGLIRGLILDTLQLTNDKKSNCN